MNITGTPTVGSLVRSMPRSIDERARDTSFESAIGRAKQNLDILGEPTKESKKALRNVLSDLVAVYGANRRTLEAISDVWHTYVGNTGEELKLKVGEEKSNLILNGDRPTGRLVDEYA